MRLSNIVLLIVITVLFSACNSSIGFPTETPAPTFGAPRVQPTPTPQGTFLIMSGSNSQTSQVFQIASETLEVRWKFFKFGNQKIDADIYKAGDRTAPVFSFDTGDQDQGAKQIKLSPGSYYINIQSGDVQNWTVTLIKHS
jgi:hypothetical protein